MNCLLSEIGKWAKMEANFFCKITDCVFHGPLGHTNKWPLRFNLMGIVGERMQALLDKVKSLQLALVVQVLEFNNKFHEKAVSIDDFISSDTML